MISNGLFYSLYFNINLFKQKRFGECDVDEYCTVTHQNDQGLYFAAFWESKPGLYFMS